MMNMLIWRGESDGPKQRGSYDNDNNNNIYNDNDIINFQGGAGGAKAAGKLCLLCPRTQHPVSGEQYDDDDEYDDDDDDDDDGDYDGDVVKRYQVSNFMMMMMMMMRMNMMMILMMMVMLMVVMMLPKGVR